MIVCVIGWWVSFAARIEWEVMQCERAMIRQGCGFEKVRVWRVVRVN